MKKYDFSRRHWLVIVLCFFLYVINNACTTDGENVLLPRIAEMNGWEYSTVLTLATVAGCLGVIGQLIFGRICAKKGSKFTMVLCLFLTSGFLMLYGSSSSLWAYTIGLFGTISCSTSYSYIAGNSLIANWFPQKKGLALGIISMGSPFSTIVMVSLLTFLITAVGLFKGVLFIGIIVFILAILCLFVVYDKPEMCGETPDNLKGEELEQLKIKEESSATLTTKEILKNKNFWYIVIIIGLLNMSITGLMAQFLVRYTSSGFKESTAILMMSICAACGLIASSFAGGIENKLGTKKAYVLFAFVFIFALLINATNITPLVYLSIPIFGCILTMIQIFLTAFPVSVFGRNNFEAVNGILFPLISMIGQTTFLIISLCIHLFGEVRYAYIVFAAMLLVSIIIDRKVEIQ